MENKLCKQNIALVTGRAAKHIVKSLISGEKCVEVVVLPVNVMSMLTIETLKNVILKNKEILKKLKNSDIIIVPGSIKGDVKELAKIIKKPVYKGTRSVIGIPYIIKYIREGGKLHTLLPADEILLREPINVNFVKAFEIGDVAIPFRGPPLVLLSEIPPQVKDDKLHKIADTVIKEESDLILVGSYEHWDLDKIKARLSQVEKLLENKKKPLGIEVPNSDILRRTKEINVDFIYVAAQTLINLGSFDLNSKMAVIVADRDINVLKNSVNKLNEIGIRKIVLDPVLDLPFFGMTLSLDRYKTSILQFKHPLLFSAANVVDEIEADPHGIHALLATMAAELKASIYSVVIDSYKSIHEVSEAKEALRLALEAWNRGATERGLYSKLLILNQRTPPPPPRLQPGEPIEKVEPLLDKAGYFIIDVDHQRGVIILEFHGKKKTFRIESSEGLSLAREAVRRTDISKEHAAYLGYELHKAELALILGKTYSQDEPILEVPWREKVNEGDKFKSR